MFTNVFTVSMLLLGLSDVSQPLIESTASSIVGDGLDTENGLQDTVNDELIAGMQYKRVDIRKSTTKWKHPTYFVFSYGSTGTPSLSGSYVETNAPLPGQTSGFFEGINGRQNRYDILFTTYSEDEGKDVQITETDDVVRIDFIDGDTIYKSHCGPTSRRPTLADLDAVNALCGDIPDVIP